MIIDEQKPEFTFTFSICTIFTKSTKKVLLVLLSFYFSLGGKMKKFSMFLIKISIFSGDEEGEKF